MSRIIKSSRLTCSIFLLILAFLISSTNASVRHLERDDITGHLGSTREEILAKREHRKAEFSSRLQQLKKQWDDHVSGKVPLKEGFETERLKKKIKAYEKKLEHLNQEIDDRVSVGGFGIEHLDGEQSDPASHSLMAGFLFFIFSTAH